MTRGPLIIIALVLILWGMLIGLYNNLVALKNAVENAYSDIDVQMKMRFDLVDNLVNTVKGYASHEKDTLEKLTLARSQWMNATSPAEKAEANQNLTGALKTLFATAEAYPDLKANTNFLDLQTQLREIEDQIAGSRRYYNATIKEYNNALQKFPGNIVANVFNFQNEQDYFAITNEEEKVAPKVQF